VTNIFVWSKLGQEEKKVLEEKISGANLIYGKALSDTDQKEKFLQSEIALEERL
jgi:hypothetical protein